MKSATTTSKSPRRGWEANDSPAHAPRAPSDTRPAQIAGILIIVLIFGGLGGWAATAPLASAVIAQGTVAVESNRKVVQHYEGGIIREILVEEAQNVSKGQVLVRLDRTQSQARADLVRNQLDAKLALEARLIAERDSATTVAFPAEVMQRISLPTVDAAVTDQRRQFAERRASIEGRIDILDSRSLQLEQKIKGLDAERKGMENQIRILDDELVGLRDLHEKGYYPLNKVRAREREQARLEGLIGRTTAEIWEAREEIGETSLQIEKIRQERSEEVIEQLRAVREEIADLRERVVVAFDTLKRVEIYAPLSGTVQNLKFHTIGGVVKAGEPLMEIVPSNDDLIIHAKVRPLDIDNVHIGLDAEVRFSAFSARSTPTAQGFVESVSRDLIAGDSNEEPYFLAMVVTDNGTIPIEIVDRLSAGMPVDVLIETEERTVLDYLSAPLLDMIAKSLREE